MVGQQVSMLLPGSTATSTTTEPSGAAISTTAHKSAAWTSGAWDPEPEVYGDGDQFGLPGLTGPIDVAEVYEDILDAEGRSLLR